MERRRFESWRKIWGVKMVGGMGMEDGLKRVEEEGV